MALLCSKLLLLKANFPTRSFSFLVGNPSIFPFFSPGQRHLGDPASSPWAEKAVRPSSSPSLLPWDIAPPVEQQLGFNKQLGFQSTSTSQKGNSTGLNPAKSCITQIRGRDLSELNRPCRYWGLWPPQTWDAIGDPGAPAVSVVEHALFSVNWKFYISKSLDLRPIL